MKLKKYRKRTSELEADRILNLIKRAAFSARVIAHVIFGDATMIHRVYTIAYAHGIMLSETRWATQVKLAQSLDKQFAPVVRGHTSRHAGSPRLRRAG